MALAYAAAPVIAPIINFHIAPYIAPIRGTRFLTAAPAMVDVPRTECRKLDEKWHVGGTMQSKIMTIYNLTSMNEATSI